MRYWLYKNNSAEGGPAGYRGDWLREVFQDNGVKGWGGHYSSTSPVVWRLLSEDVSVGDVVWRTRRTPRRSWGSAWCTT